VNTQNFSFTRKKLIYYALKLQIKERNSSEVSMSICIKSVTYLTVFFTEFFWTVLYFYLTLILKYLTNYAKFIVKAFKF